MQSSRRAGYARRRSPASATAFFATMLIGLRSLLFSILQVLRLPIVGGMPCTSIAAELEVMPQDSSHVVRRLATRPPEVGTEAHYGYWSACTFAANRFERAIMYETTQCLVASAARPIFGC